MHMSTDCGWVEAVQLCVEGKDTRTVQLYAIGPKRAVQLYVVGPREGVPTFY